MVSICVPTLNARAFLAERMESIFFQTYQDWELIVCDSYSEDGTWEFLQSLAGDTRVRLYQVPKEGLYAGWNECLHRSRGEFIHIATADDTCEPNFLETLVNLLHENPAVGVAFCDLDEIDATGAVIHSGAISNRRSYLQNYATDHVLSAGEAFVSSCHFVPLWNSISSVVFRRGLLEKTGLFPTQFGSCGDVYWALAASIHSSMVFFNRPLATWRRHENQATYQSEEYKLEFQIYRAITAVRRDFEEQIQSLLNSDFHLKRLIYTYQDLRSIEKTGLNRELLRSNPKSFFRRLGFFGLRRPEIVAMHLLRGIPWVQAPPVLEALDSCLTLQGVHRDRAPNPASRPQ